MSDPTLLDLRQTLQDAVDSWPEFDDPDEPVCGGDLVDWFAGWRLRAQCVLAQTPKGSQ